MKGVVFPGERQRELQNIPCARSAHNIKLFTYYLIHPSPDTAIPVYLCPLFYYHLTCVTASKGTQHFCDTHRLQGPKTTHEHLALHSKRSHCTTMLAVTQGFLHTWQLSWFYSIFSAAAQSFLGAKQLTRPVTEAEATWPRAAPNVTEGILARLSLRGLGNHLLAENNSRICCSSAKSLLSALLGPNFFSYCRILPHNTDAHKEQGFGYSWTESSRSGVFRVLSN